MLCRNGENSVIDTDRGNVCKKFDILLAAGIWMTVRLGQFPDIPVLQWDATGL